MEIIEMAEQIALLSNKGSLLSKDDYLQVNALTKSGLRRTLPDGEPCVSPSLSLLRRGGNLYKWQLMVIYVHIPENGYKNKESSFLQRHRKRAQI